MMQVVILLNRLYIETIMILRKSFYEMGLITRHQEQKTTSVLLQPWLIELIYMLMYKALIHLQVLLKYL